MTPGQVAGPRVLGPVAAGLARWIACGSPYPAEARPRLRFYRWSRFAFALNRALQRRSVPPLSVGDDPLLVLGPWRSGTTWLHELLAAHPAFCTPRTWQCMAPATFALTGKPREAASVARPMDDFAVETDSPQEDEFALLALGGPSVYRGFVDPRRLPGLAALLEAEAWPPGWPGEDDWLSFLGTVRALAPAQGRRLLLKSPNHAYRRPALVARFPALRAVWIMRDPAAVHASNVRMWHAMCALYGLASPPPGVVEAFVTQALAATARALDGWCAALPPERLVVVRFEHLVARPRELAVQTLQRCGVAVNDAAIRAIDAAVRHRQDVRGATAVAAPASAAPALALLAQAHERAWSSHGLRLAAPDGAARP